MISQPRLHLSHPTSHREWMSLGAAHLAPQPRLTARLYYFRVFWVFFPHDICYYFHLKRHGIPLSPCPRRWAEGPGARTGLERVLLQIPPQRTAESQGKKSPAATREHKLDPEGQMQSEQEALARGEMKQLLPLFCLCALRGRAAAAAALNYRT